MKTTDLNFINTTVRFTVADEAEAAFRPIARFFRHLMSDDLLHTPTFHVDVRSYTPDFDVPGDVWAVEQSIIRRSSAAEFNFDAHVLKRGERRIYANRETLLDTPFDARKDNTFRLGITDGSTIQALDFIRDLIIRNEESLGTVVLHASGLHRDGEALAVAGPKGAGKTTTLLSALRRPGWHYYTGDKLFCVPVDGEITVYPWRDYPYVGMGTIRADARLEAMVRAEVSADLDDYPDTRKLLLDPDVFESWLGAAFTAGPKRLGAILLPRVRPGEPLTTRHITEDNERWALLNTIVDRQVDTTFFTWQSYLVPDYTEFYRTLAEIHRVGSAVRMVSLRGTLDVDPDVVLESAAAEAAERKRVGR